MGNAGTTEIGRDPVPPERIEPQGSGSTLDADTLDGQEDGQVDAATLGGKSEGSLSVDHASTAGDADTIDGNDTPLPASAHDYTAPITASNGALAVATDGSLAVDGSGNLYVPQGSGSGLNADTVDGTEAADLGGGVASEGGVTSVGSVSSGGVSRTTVNYSQSYSNTPGLVATPGSGGYMYEQMDLNVDDMSTSSGRIQVANNDSNSENVNTIGYLVVPA